MSPTPHIPTPDIIVFGGSFDPPHLGHWESIQFAAKTFPQAEIDVIPSFHTPVNSSQTKSNVASFEHRFEMCKLAFKTSHKNIHILDIEKHLKIPSFTVRTLEFLKDKNPDKRFGVLIGLDQFLKFHTWFQAPRILELSSLIVILREDMNLEEATAKFIKNMQIKNVKVFKNYMDLPPYPPLFFIRKTPHTTSSSQIRMQLSSRGISDTKALFPEVLHYINVHQLYQSS